MTFSEKLEEEMFKHTVTEDEAIVSVDLRVFQNIKLDFITKCREKVMGQYDAYWQEGSLPGEQLEKAEGLGELSLVPTDELDAKITTQVLASKCDEKNFDALYGLNRRFGFMEGFEELKNEDNPLSPFNLTGAVVEQLNTQNFSANTKELLFEQFGKSVLGEVHKLYAEINQILIQGGILPTLPRPAAKSEGSSSRKDSRQAAESERTRSDEQARRGEQAPAGAPQGGQGGIQGGTQGGAQIHAIDPRLEYGLKALFSKVSEQRPVSDYQDGVKITGDTFESRELLGELTSLQKEDLFGQAASGEADLIALKSQLNQSLQVNGERRPFVDQDENVIDIVAMFFDLVLDDHQLPDAVRALIGRMQIPVLKVAMMDHSFFAKKSHPVRRLINSFSKAGLGVCDQNTRIRNVVLEKMESIVDQVLLEFEEDISLFVDLLDEFEAFLAQQMQQIEIIEERSRKSSENNDRLELTKRQASFEIASRLNGRKAPIFVKDFLDNVWHDVLVLALLRKEREPEEVEHCLILVDLLIESVMVHEVVSERDRIMQALPRLLKDLRLGLEDISYDPYETRQWFKELEAWHLKVLSRQIPEEVVDIPVLEEVVVEDVMDVSERMMEEMPSDKYSRKATKIEVNDWIEFTNDSDETVRARLSWKSEVTLKCMFVNDKGMKVLELSVPELAEEMRNKRVSLVGNDREGLFDRAMGGLMRVFDSDGPAPQPA